MNATSTKDSKVFLMKDNRVKDMCKRFPNPNRRPIVLSTRFGGIHCLLSRWMLIIPEFFCTKGFVTPNIARALDLDDHSFTDEQRVAQIKENLCKYGLPFLAELDSLEKMRNTLLNRSLATIFVRRNLRDL